MAQISKYKWNIVSKDGHVIQGDLSFNTPREAEQYVKNYITSFQTWDYDMRPL